MALGHSPSIVTNGLLWCLDAGNTKSYPGSGTSWYDLSGNSRTATIYNGPTYSSGSLVFDGLNDHCGGASDIKWTPDGSVGYSTLTVEVWVKTTDTSGSIYSKPWNGSGEYNLRIGYDALYLQSFSGFTGLNHPTAINDGNWKQIVCQVNNTQMRTYVNGNKFSASANHGLTGGITTIGDQTLATSLMTLYPYGQGWAGVASQAISGNLAAVKVYNRVLSDDEILQNFNALRGRFSI